MTHNDRVHPIGGKGRSPLGDPVVALERSVARQNGEWTLNATGSLSGDSPKEKNNGILRISVPEVIRVLIE
jgi:hypothetical protein